MYEGMSADEHIFSIILGTELTSLLFDGALSQRMQFIVPLLHGALPLNIVIVLGAGIAFGLYAASRDNLPTVREKPSAETPSDSFIEALRQCVADLEVELAASKANNAHLTQLLEIQGAALKEIKGELKTLTGQFNQLTYVCIFLGFLVLILVCLVAVLAYRD